MGQFEEAFFQERSEKYLACSILGQKGNSEQLVDAVNNDTLGKHTVCCLQKCWTLYHEEE